jgi:hypothetical protein
MVLCCYTPGKSRTLFRRFGTLRSAVVSRRDDTNMLLDQTKPAEDVDDHYQQTFAAQMDGLAGTKVTFDIRLIPMTTQSLSDFLGHDGKIVQMCSVAESSLSSLRLWMCGTLCCHAYQPLPLARTEPILSQVHRHHSRSSSKISGILTGTYTGRSSFLTHIFRVPPNLRIY